MGVCWTLNIPDTWPNSNPISSPKFNYLFYFFLNKNEKRINGPMNIRKFGSNSSTLWQHLLWQSPVQLSLTCLIIYISENELLQHETLSYIFYNHLQLPSFSLSVSLSPCPFLSYNPKYPPGTTHEELVLHLNWNYDYQ